MKVLRFLFAFLALGLILSSCQKDFSFEAGNAKGALAKDAAGDCAPILVNGNYFKDTTLNATNYVDVQVDFTKIGVYTIKTDTVNGYSFSATASTALLGPNTVRLIGSGKPVRDGFDVFTVKFDGGSCEFSVVVNLGTGGGGGTTARFTFPNTGAACTGATQTTNFFATLPTNPTTHFITLLVDVSQAGTYSLSTTLLNGLTFTASGSFATTGNGQPLILRATGTPTASGLNTYNFSTTTPTASSCAFDLTVQAAPAPAAFTFNCAGVTTQGTYQVGTAMTAANTMTVPITVASGGSYNITTTVNGVTFAGANVLPATPAAQTIILNATGTATAGASPSTIFTLSGGGGASCAVTVPFTAAPSPATFTFNCAGVTFLGTYQVGTAMTSGNTMTVPITVTGGGTYNITTTVNGVTFASNGTLPATPASQSITLNATGTPLPAAAPSTIFTLSGGGGTNCAVTIPFTAASLSYIRGRIGSATAPIVTFNNNITGLNDLTLGQTLAIGGDGTGMEDIGLTVSNITGLLAINTDYNVNQLLTTFIAVDCGHTNAAGTVFSATSGLTPQLVRPFTVRFSTISANRLIGTFSGNMDDGAGGIVAFYGGEFDVTF